MKPLADLLSRHPLPDLSRGKDDSGTVVVVGGPPTCPGAAVLVGTAALRVGAGRVQLVVAPDVATAVAVAVPEALVLGWDLAGEPPSSVAERLAGADVVVIGSGCDHLDPEVVRLVSSGTTASVILDAGAIPAATTLRRAGLVLAPNEAEAAELVDGQPDAVGELARSLATRLGVPIAVRGARSAVSDGAEGWCFDDAPPGLGTPGSGDVFIGVLAALLAAGLPRVAALGWAVAIHAGAGHHLARRTPVGYLASDVATALPHALSQHL